MICRARITMIELFAAIRFRPPQQKSHLLLKLGRKDMESFLYLITYRTALSSAFMTVVRGMIFHTKTGKMLLTFETYTSSGHTMLGPVCIGIFIFQAAIGLVRGYMPLARPWASIPTITLVQPLYCAVPYLENLLANTRLVEGIQTSRVFLLIFDRFLSNKPANRSVDARS